MRDHVGETNRARNAARARRTPPMLRVGQVLWDLPIRWWEPEWEGCYPARVWVAETRPQWTVGDGRASGVLVYVREYGHTVYMNGTQLFDTPQQAWEEAATRTRIHNAALHAETSALVDRLLAPLRKA